jgi:hypothetical protein
MLAYLRRAIVVWRRYPLALTAALIMSDWIFSLLNLLAMRLSGTSRAVAEVCAFVLIIVGAYVAQVFLSRVVGDLSEGHTPDWKSALALCRRGSTLQTSIGLFWRALLWLTVSMCIGILCWGVVYAIALIAHHRPGHGALQPLFTWVSGLILTACIAKYSFAIPYVAFSQGTVVTPIGLSVTRTKPILRPLIWLTICGTATTLIISEIFKMADLHLALTPTTKLVWNLLRGATQSVPSAWLLIAVTLIAHQDWSAMQSGMSLQIDGSPAGEKAG